MYDFYTAIVDKLIIIFAGFYLAFVWPWQINRRIAKEQLSAEVRRYYSWMRPIGIVLMFIGLMLFAAELSK